MKWKLILATLLMSAALFAQTTTPVNGGGSTVNGSSPITPVPVGIFADTGSLSAWPVAYTQTLGQVFELFSVSVHANSSWVGCTSPGSVVVKDDQGNTLATVSLTANAVTPGPYTGQYQEVDTFTVAGTFWLAPYFTSPGGCSQYPSQVAIDLITQEILIDVKPMAPSVAAGSTVQLTGNVILDPQCVPQGSACGVIANQTVSWSVDGIAGGNSTVGTISATGLYTAPATTGTHTITATSNATSAAATSVTVTVS